MIVLQGCANIIPPAGGPRDSLPPELLRANPLDSTRNFKGNRITLSFNEFVDVQNVQENLIVSPLPKLTPTVDYKLNTVTVRLKDTLEPNTTYTLNFGNAIKDVNEGNALKSFTYTFSTGPYIDSLELKGKVILAETGKIDSSLVVILHSSADDSAVINQKPRYMTRLDGNGDFIFRNLPPATFYLYALKDESGTLRYFTDKQLFAFAEKPVVVSASTPPVTLYAYAAKQGIATTTTTLPTIAPQGRNKLNGAVNEKRLKYQTNLINNEQDLQGNFSMTFEQRLRRFDSSRIRLTADSNFSIVPGYYFIKDSTTTLQLVNNWKENTVYHLILDKDFAEDSAGRKLLKTDTISFRTKKIADYGRLKLKFRNLDMSKKPVLQFVSGETIYKSFPLTGPDFSQPLFFPGEYELRILYDTNGNGKWDPGAFFNKHKQPEIVKPVQRRIVVKSNFENEVEIAL
jgi:hypothetical protein